MQKKICPLHHFQLTLMIHNKVFFFEHHQIYLSKPGLFVFVV
jgi:hypothetical protein